MRVLGADPGLSGAFSVLECAPNCVPRLVSCLDAPVVGIKAKRRLAVGKIAEWLVPLEAEQAFIERAQGMPDQGASSTFIYGRATGAAEATILLCGVRLRTAEPTVWKRDMGLLKQGKAASLQLARTAIRGAAEILAREKDHNRAESMLIAVFGAHKLGIPVIWPGSKGEEPRLAV